MQANFLGVLATAVYMTDADQVPSGSDGWGHCGTRSGRALRTCSPPRHRQAALVRVWSAETSALRNVFGVGWVAVGDAACAFDPLSSLGICNALESGRSAADAIVVRCIRTTHVR